MELAFREFGQGQPLIILHGLFGQSDNWNTLAKRFAENNFHVFTVDQRNHGLSPHSDEWTYDSMAKDLKTFIDTHQLKKPILIGHSMGGKTVMFFEMMFPNISLKSIVVDISPRKYSAHHDDVLKALNAVDFDSITSRKEAEEIMSQYISDFGTKQFLLKNIYWRTDDDKKMAWRFNLKTITEEYNNIGVAIPDGMSTTNMLFIKGEKSNYIMDSDIEMIKKYFNHSEIKTVMNSGHWVHAEQPNAFFDMVLEFIK